MNLQHIVIALGIGVAVIVIGGWYLITTEVPSGTEIVSDVPTNEVRDESVVATVNGEPIARNQFEQFKSQTTASQGIDTTMLDAETTRQLDAQLVDELIGQVLIGQAVQSSGIIVSEEEVDAQVDATATQLGGADAFSEALAAEGFTEESFRAQVSSELATQAYLEQELDISSLTASDEEIAATYAEAAAQDETVPPLEEVGPQVEQLVIQQKQQTLYAQLIDELRAVAEVEILL